MREVIVVLKAPLFFVSSKIIAFAAAVIQRKIIID